MNTRSIKSSYNPRSRKHSNIFISRVKKILFSPKTEWAVIANQEPETNDVFLGYMLPLIIASAGAGFIGYAFIQGRGFYEDAAINLGLFVAIRTVFISTFGVWLSAAIINSLAPKFGAEKNMGRAVELIAYAMTPAWVGGLIMIYPPIGFVGLLFGLYGLYLLYLGLPDMLKVPQDKIMPYTVISMLTVLIITIGIGFIFRSVIWVIIIGILKSILINSHPLK